MSDLAINLQQVSKTYKGRVVALDDVALEVRRGEIFGLLGPNGAGKSTLVKIMLTLVRANHAAGTILSQPLGHKPTLARVGYLPEHHRFPRYLSGRQTLDFFGALAGVERRVRRRRADELLATVGMTDAANRKVSTYSKGMMQRVGVAQALINDPDLVVLDEPTDGVDPVGRRDIRDVLVTLRGQGKSVLVNSHLLSELEMISDRVGILVKGHLVRQGTLDELTLARQFYEIECVPGPTPAGSAGLLSQALATHAAVAWDAAEPPRGTRPDGLNIEIHAACIRISTTDPERLQPVLDALRAAGVTIRRVQAIRPSLEQLFIEAVGGAEVTP